MSDEPNILDQIISTLPAPDELDELMARDPTSLQAQDIDKIIAYQRKARANREAGIKAPRPKRGVDPNAPKVSLDLSALGLAPAKPQATVSKPGAGLRRI